VQYASATGTGTFASNAVTPINATLAPGQYLLVQMAAGTGSAPALPTPDAIGTVNMSASGGKVALVSTITGLACNGGSFPCSPTQEASIVDLVGWGGANYFEGLPAPATTNTTALLRHGGGCADTNDNGADFPQKCLKMLSATSANEQVQVRAHAGEIIDPNAEALGHRS